MHDAAMTPGCFSLRKAAGRFVFSTRGDATMKTHLFDHVPAVRTCLVVFLTVTFFVTSLGLENIVYADEGTGMVALSRPTESVMLTGIKTFPGEPFRLDFLIDEGDRHLSSKERGAEAMRLIKYFMAALTVPESDLWVNLSPYEKDRVIAPGFGKTDMGSDMLAQDYLLKRLSASLTYPKGNLGEDYWRQLRAEMSDRFGSADRTVETMHRIWIVPDIADVVVADGAACIAKTKLKVMMEKDYLASEDAVSAVTGSSKNAGRSESKDLSADVYRRVLLPSVEHEVNDGAHFKELRQMYNALILATWYKRHLKETVLAGLYADKNKVGGIDDADADAKDKIYAEYLASFKKGVYELIKAERDPQTQKTVHRQYFSGGIVLDAGRVYRETADLSEMTKKAVRRDAGRTYRVSSALLTKEQGAALLSVPQAETATAEPQKVSLVPLDAVATLAGGIGFWLATANPIVTVLGALAATVIMRVGMTGAYAFHEWMHIVLAGKKTLTRENLRANVSLHDWAGMLVPFFGKVPQGLKVKAEGLSRMKAGLNRAGTMAATAAVTGVGAAATVAAAHGGDAMTAAALLPAVLGTAWVTLNALWSDVLKPALGKSTDGELECGIGMYMMRKDKNDVGLFPERAMKGMRGVFDTTVVRGHQAAGLLSEGEDKNGVHLVGVKTVNEKRGNLPEILERKFEKSVV